MRRRLQTAWQWRFAVAVCAAVVSLALAGCGKYGPPLRTSAGGARVSLPSENRVASPDSGPGQRQPRDNELRDAQQDQGSDE